MARCNSPTAAGIGPCLGQILADRCPARLVVDVLLVRPYGDALVDEVETIQPDAVIWDTTKHGKPDLLELALKSYAEFHAEAVFIVSNSPPPSASSTTSSGAGSPRSDRSGTPEPHHVLSHSVL